MAYLGGPAVIEKNIASVSVGTRAILSPREISPLLERRLRRIERPGPCVAWPLLLLSQKPCENHSQHHDPSPQYPPARWDGVTVDYQLPPRSAPPPGPVSAPAVPSLGGRLAREFPPQSIRGREGKGRPPAILSRALTPSPSHDMIVLRRLLGRLFHPCQMPLSLELPSGFWRLL